MCVEDFGFWNLRDISERIIRELVALTRNGNYRDSSLVISHVVVAANASDSVDRQNPVSYKA